jgi:hypothetical protein
MAKLTLENFEKEMEKVLSEYSEDVKSNLDEATKKVMKEGVKLLRSESKAKFGTSDKRDKKYATSWTTQFETGRMSTQGTIYNTEAGLPHLLENGHVSRNGTGRTLGSVKGREHIAPVDEKIATAFEREVKNKL